MVEDLHHDPLRHACREQDRRGGVAQVVQAQALLFAGAGAAPGLGADLKELEQIERERIEGSSVSPTERGTMRILSMRSSGSLKTPGGTACWFT